MQRSLIALGAVVAALLAVPAGAAACSRDDAAYFDGFPDASCLLTLQNTEIDTFGGLRLVTDGLVSEALWDTDVHFASGIGYESRTFPPLEQSGLEVAGTDAAARLRPSVSALPLNPASGPGLSPAASTLLDTESVADPAVIKVGAKYVLYYAGTAEDGSGPAIFRLESDTPTAFARPADYGPVLMGTPGEFDENGVYGPDVVHDPADTEAPFKMWFTGRGDTYDQIGYATSMDGITWTKLADPVLLVGLPGSQDSFRASHPTVLFDGGLWKMWYEGDDSNVKSIHYATSTDGLAWSKAGAVIEVADGSGNTEFGVFAPTVWKDGETLKIVVGGRKETSTQGVYETKLIPGSSTDGLEWTLQGAGGLNPGNYSNLNSPEVLIDGATLRLFFSADDANDGDPYPAIDVTEGLGGNADPNAMLDHAPFSSVFDARAVSGVAAARPGGDPDHLAGVYTGFSSAGTPRLGAAHSSDRHDWIKDPGPILAVGNNNSFDEGGHRDPALLYRQNGLETSDYFLYFAGLASPGFPTIGAATAQETATTLLPDHATWTNKAQLLTAGTAGTFDDEGQTNPSIVAPAQGTYWLYYTAHAGAGVTSIARATSSAPTSGFGSRTQVALAGAPLCDPDGFRDPLVDADSATDVELYYTGLEELDSDSDGIVDVTIERVCHAHSSDGVNFTRTGVILNPSRTPFAHDEAGVTPVSLVETAGEVFFFTTVTDRFGRTRAGSARSAVPAPAGHGVPSGWATYQLGDATTPGRDFRSIAGLGLGDVELWMSFLQPYSDANTSYWSDYFPVGAVAQPEDLNFLLTIRAVRWQVRMRRVDEVPSLDKVTIGHAPVHFAAAGSATTTDVTPPDDFALQNWTTMTIDSELFTPLSTGTGGGSVTVLDPDGNVLVAATPLTVPGETTVPLTGIDATAEPVLRVKLDLTSATGQASPVVRELKVAYAALQPGATPTPTPTPSPTATPTPTPVPPPPAVLTLAAAASKVVYGRTTTLSGRLTIGANGLAGTPITILQQPVGTAAPKPLTTVTTDATGVFTTIVKPSRHTTYSLALANVTAPAPVTVRVAHRLSLKVALTGRRATFTGKIGPRHARRLVTIQRKSGTSWRRVLRVRTTRRSTYRISKRLARGRYRFRAITGKDTRHLAGRSTVRRVRVR